MPDHPPTISPDRRCCSLYVHVPFCQTKCGYCDFFSVPLGLHDPQPAVERVLQELARRVSDRSGGIRSIFCGGGTPTVLPPDLLASLLNPLAALAGNDACVEFTVEANPGTIDARVARVLAKAGVTRVSLGAQSFIPTELAALERLHSPNDIKPSIAALRAAGVPRISLDLIFGIPGQTLESWRESLLRAVNLDVDHLSCYGLTFEPGTRLTRQWHRGCVTRCGEALEADMFLLAAETLAQAGYRQYEISNYAKPGCACVHNLMYWRNGSYLGVGPSAVGCVNGRRYKNVADVASYVRMIDATGLAEIESETLSREMLIHEMIMMQLRLADGLCIADFRERTGVDPVDLFRPVLDRLVASGKATQSNTHIALTREGWLIADAIMVELAACLM